MEKLNKFIENCKGEINISINEHRSSYETVGQWIMVLLNYSTSYFYNLLLFVR